MSKGKSQGQWVTIPTNVPSKPKYEFEAHAWTGVIIGKMVCGKCGLIRLNNPFTAWAVKMGCQNDLHPNYKQHRRRGP